MRKIILMFMIVVSVFAEQSKKSNDPGMKLILQGKFKEAMNIFKKRCQKNDGYACGMVGFFYSKGFNIVVKNKKKALYYYKKGCKLNDSDSCALIGYIYYRNKHIQKSKKFLKKACNLGNRDTCEYLKYKKIH